MSAAGAERVRGKAATFVIEISIKDVHLKQFEDDGVCYGSQTLEGLRIRERCS